MEDVDSVTGGGGGGDPAEQQQVVGVPRVSDEHQGAISTYCASDLALATLNSTVGERIRSRRKEATQLRKAIIDLIMLDTAYPIADMQYANRVYLISSEPPSYLGVCKTTSQRNLQPEIIENVLRTVTVDDIEERFLKRRMRREKKTSIEQLDIPAGEAVVETALQMLREQCRKNAYKPEFRETLPRSWDKTVVPPPIPDGWREKVERVVALGDEVAEIEPPFKRQCKTLREQRGESESVLHEYFETLPQENRMQPVVIESGDASSIGVMDDPRKVTSTSSLAFLTYKVSERSQKLTVANAKPAIDFAIKHSLGDRGKEPYTRESVATLLADRACIRDVIEKVHDMLMQWRIDSLKQEKSVKMVTSMPSSAHRRLDAAGGGDDDDDDDDDN